MWSENHTHFTTNFPTTPAQQKNSIAYARNSPKEINGKAFHVLWKQYTEYSFILWKSLQHFRALIPQKLNENFQTSYPPYTSLLSLSFPPTPWHSHHPPLVWWRFYLCAPSLCYQHCCLAVIIFCSCWCDDPTHHHRQQICIQSDNSIASSSLSVTATLSVFPLSSLLLPWSCVDTALLL